MESRKGMDIIAYYLSEFDAKAFETLGFTSQAKGFEKIASFFDKGGNYLRRLRDEYDVVTSSSRKGQRNRPPRTRIITTSEYLRQFSFDELTEIVKAFALSCTIKKLEQKATVTHETARIDEIS